MYNTEVEERLAGVMLLRWHTAAVTGDERAAVTEAGDFINSQLDEAHPIRQAFISLGFIASSGNKLAPLEERQKLLRQMLDYTALIIKGLQREQTLAEAPRAFYTAALLLEQGRGDLLHKIVAYKPY
jgi:hypothetical protein